MTLAGSEQDPGSTPYNPRRQRVSAYTPGLGWIPFRSPLLGESRLISFPRGTEMFQFPRLPPRAYVFSAGDTALPVPGFPIRESAGQSLFSSSPRLIAAVHALRRLLMPRHPPCALTILTVIDARTNPDAAGDFLPVLLANCAVFKDRRGRTGGLPAWSLKTQQYGTPPEGEPTRLGRHARDARRP